MNFKKKEEGYVGWEEKEGEMMELYNNFKK